MDIVTNSLYTEREVFLRELLSNASDALEKLRYTISATADGSGGSEQDSAASSSVTVCSRHLPLQIEVFTDAERGELVIQDSGIGMDDVELASNLGTIARSGSKAFVRQMNATKLAQQHGAGAGADKDKAKGKVEQFEEDFVSGTSSIIGQFGVGFYSVFMIADRVDVYSKSAKTAETDHGYYWTSDGCVCLSVCMIDGMCDMCIL